jgi:class I fructose-bisphosphate aldolase
MIVPYPGNPDSVRHRRTKAVYESLTSDHPIDMCRWQVVNNYMGRIGLINTGGESKGASDLAEAVRTR